MAMFLSRYWRVSRVRLLISRHGETLENTLSILTGQSESSLTEKGKEQAQKLVKRLLDSYEIDSIFTSDLSRAMYTAETISKFTGIGFVVEPLLRERCFGKYEMNDKSLYYSDVRKYSGSAHLYDLNG